VGQGQRDTLWRACCLPTAPGIPGAGGLSASAHTGMARAPSLFSLTIGSVVVDEKSRCHRCQPVLVPAVRTVPFQAQGEGAQLSIKRRAGGFRPFRSDRFGHGCQQDGDLL